jgi:hypothetical protein
VEKRMNVEAEAGSRGPLSQPDYLKKKADLTRLLAERLGIKYINEPPYSHKLNPLQALFLRIDNSIDIPEL